MKDPTDPMQIENVVADVRSIARGMAHYNNPEPTQYWGKSILAILQNRDQLKVRIAELQEEVAYWKGRNP
jgi:hypothetical protein